jgi:hypothetical protein
MDSSRTVKRILEWRLVGRQQTGSSRIAWLDDLCTGMKIMNVKN